MHFTPLKPPCSSQYRNIYQENPSPRVFTMEYLVMGFLGRNLALSPSLD